MTNRFDAAQPVGQIVAVYPGAARLFQRYGIDFCCGGGRPLGEVLDRMSIPHEGVLQELHRMYQADVSRGTGLEDWREAAPGAIIDRILSAHHAYLHQVLPVLGQFTAKVARVHGDRHPELRVLSELFQQFQAGVAQHLAAEEQELFPLIRAYEQSGSPADLEQALLALAELEQEHEAAGDLLARMRQATDGYRLPPDACRTYTVTFHELSALESDTFMHIHLENNILFPRLREVAQGA